MYLARGNKARKSFKSVTSYKKKVIRCIFWFWCLWITWRLCNPCFRERKCNCAFFVTQHRQDILKRNWDVVFQSMTEKKKFHISPQSGQYIYFKFSFLSTDLQTFSKKNCFDYKSLELYLEVWLDSSPYSFGFLI